MMRLYDPIDSWGGDWGVSAKEFARALDRLPDDTTEIRLHINSPGGEVWEALAILNRCATTRRRGGRGRRHRRLGRLVHRRGADEVVMGRNTQLMIHDAWGLCVGNAADMRATADLLDQISDNIASSTPTRRAGRPTTGAATMLAETWYAAEEAVDAGLADKVEGEADAGREEPLRPVAVRARRPRVRAGAADARRGGRARPADDRDRRTSCPPSRGHEQAPLRRAASPDANPTNLPVSTACRASPHAHEREPPWPTPELHDQRASAWDKMPGQRRAPPRRRWTADLEATYDAAEADYDRLDAQITRLEKHEARAAQNAQVDRRGVVAPDGDAGPRGADHLRRGVRRLPQAAWPRSTTDERTALAARRWRHQERAARSAPTPPAATSSPRATARDHRADEGLRRRQEVATVITTDRVNPAVADHRRHRQRRASARGEHADDRDRTRHRHRHPRRVHVHLGADRVSLQLAQRLGFDVEAFVAGKLRRAHRPHPNQHFTTGTGSSQPQGIVTGATSGVTAAGVAAITADELIDLQHSVDPAYRNERSQFMLSDTALKVAPQAQGHRIRRVPVPAQHHGRRCRPARRRRYVINQDMAVPATGVKSVLFGDFEAGYVIRIVQDFQIIIFTERYPDYLQVGHSSFMRADGTCRTPRPTRPSPRRDA